MDGVLCDIAAAYQQAARTHPDVAFPQSIPGLFASLRVIPGAIEAVAELRSNPRLDVWILSAPSTRNPACYSEKRIWVEKVFDYPLAKRLILASDKSLLRGDVLIDDNISGKGQDRFEGEVLHFGSSRFPTWASVLEHLRRRLRFLSADTGATEREAEDHTAPVVATRPAAAWRVRSVEVLPDYCLRVVFNDGTAGVVRMKRLIHSDSAGIFSALSDPARFGDVHVELGAVSWPGDIDLAPDAMHAAIASSGEWIP
ncbi:5' nucleotidase, NT5C type [Sinimarinibacterium sp. CAU 1509]|uniref:5' nucleotidase, NT5C type n=1 Tax=Sinimarinibacterium sp. CAU 1509 TaxID=2562283 RepID=UPI001B7F831A|nr:DUF2442 domain-containing protein [Sinimarinibacterium sp. CAU 1509]